MKLNRIVSLSLIPLNTLLLFLLLFEDSVVVPVWLQVFGRMHPLMLHFPIVLTILFSAFVFFAPAEWRNKTWFSDLCRVLILIAAVTAAFSAIMGMFLSKDGGYDTEAILWHKWTGVAVSFLLWILYSFRDVFILNNALAKSVSTIVTILIIAAGHLGAEITHGENFVLAPVTPEKSREPAALEEAVIYTDLVQPVLEEKCLSCHNSKKAKGELIMETRDLLLKGGKNGKLWDTTAASLGLMMERLHLPEEDKKHMPPKGKPQLDEDEMTIIAEWIKQGADFEKRVMELEPGDTLLHIAKSKLKPLAEKEFRFAAADEKLIRQLSNNNRVVAPLATGSPALKVNFYNSHTFSSQSLKELAPIAPQVVELSLNHMPVKDDDLQLLKPFVNLIRLNLNFTDISGKGLAELRTLPALQSLSMASTRVSYEHLRHLQECQKLRTVYIWNVPIEEKQVAELKKQHKDISYNTGFRGDTLILQLTPPIVENESEVLVEPLPLKLKHNISGTVIRYTLDGTEPDSINSPVYSDTVVLRSNVTVKAKAFREGWLSSSVVKKFFYKSTYRADTMFLITRQDDRFRGMDGKVLYDGKKNELNLNGHDWIGYRENRMEVLLAFKHPVTTKNVTLSLLKDLPAHIFPPERVEIWCGEEKNRLRLLQSLSPKPPSGMSPKENIAIECDFPPAEAKFIKVVAYPLSRMPSWHPEKGKKAWLIADEIFIN